MTRSMQGIYCRFVFLFAFTVIAKMAAAQGIFDMWGTTGQGGRYTNGTIYRTAADGSNYSIEYNFKPIINGRSPMFENALTELGGKLYGLTASGGVLNNGVLFEYDPVSGIYTVKVEFDDLNGKNPHDHLTVWNGKLYGTTYRGGANNQGVIFEYDPAGRGTYTKKTDFGSSTGISPYGSFTVAGNKLYGMTVQGGASGAGVLYEYDPATNTIAKKLDFTGAATGSSPYGSLVLYGSKLYGMTLGGGSNGNGVIFEYDPAGAGTFTKKTDFINSTGSLPYGCLTVMGSKLYGMTSRGGANNNSGVIFEFDPAGSGTYTVKFNFAAAVSGNEPLGSLTVYNNKLYGTTSQGGASGAGTLFEYVPGTNTFTKKFDFSNTASNPASPRGSLTLVGNIFYGLTNSGGNGYGTIFEFIPSGAGSLTKKIDFHRTDGTFPANMLTRAGNRFYGATSGGGSNGFGGIFEYDPATGSYTLKFDFNYASGYSPRAGMVVMNNKLYGVTYSGGANNFGVIYEYDPAGSGTYTRKHSFDSTNGKFPVARLTIFNNKLYGMTSRGGSNDFGVLFEYDPAGTGTFVKKLDFTGTANGRYPPGHLTALGSKLYGVTTNGGTNDWGTFFEYEPGTNTYTKKLDLYNAAIGAFPYSSPVVMNNKIYCTNTSSGGMIYEYDPAGSGTFTHKITFPGYSQGSWPQGRMVLNNGKLYGCNREGGSNTSIVKGGVLFEYDPAGAGTYTKKVDFTISDYNGQYPDNSELALFPAPVAVSTPGICQVLPGVLIDATNNNRWVPIMDAQGKAVAEIKANGNDLGIVQATLYINNGAVRADAYGNRYMNRNITITPASQPATPVDIRLYFRNDEYTALQTAHPVIASVNDIAVFKAEASCADGLSAGAAKVPGAAVAVWDNGGYVFTASVSSFSTFYFAAASVSALPVNLTAFTAQKITAARNRLSWQTAAETPGSTFTAERSADGKQFIAMGTVNGRGSNATYTIYDEQPLPSTNYYRLYIKEESGTARYSQVAVVNNSHDGSIMVSPVPAQQQITITNTAASLNGTIARIADMQGAERYRFVLKATNTIDIQAWPSGIYYLKLSNGEVLRIMKQ